MPLQKGVGTGLLHWFQLWGRIDLQSLQDPKGGWGNHSNPGLNRDHRVKQGPQGECSKLGWKWGVDDGSGKEGEL